MNSKLRLFVWTDFDPDAFGGLAFAVAKDETQARNLILKEMGVVREWGTLTVYPLTKRIARAVPGGS